MLPKTRSGKVMRRVLKGICEGAKMGDLTTLEDGASVEEVKRAVEQLGARPSNWRRTPVVSAASDGGWG